MSGLAGAALAAASLAYPLIVYLAIGRVSAAWILVALAALAGMRAWLRHEVAWCAVAAAAALLAAASAGGGGWLPGKLYPVVVNAALLFVFAASLRRGPSAIERIARLTEPDLSAHAVAYARRVTQVWCGFFVGNGALALGTALWASVETWALYNGLIAYLLMGTLFGAEWLVRQRVKARHG